MEINAHHLVRFGGIAQTFPRSQNPYRYELKPPLRSSTSLSPSSTKNPLSVIVMTPPSHFYPEVGKYILYSFNFVTMVCCRFVPRHGPTRQLYSGVLLTFAAAAVRIALGQYTVPDDVTEGPEADATSLTGRAILSLVMTLAGLASGVSLVDVIASRREDVTRRREEEDYESKQQQRGWLERFLDPQFRNTPEHIEEREKYFESIVNPSRVWKSGLLAPSLALCLMLLIRLFVGAPVFLGDPSALDFGWKYGIDDGDEAEKNVSFTVDFNSYGHALQGFFASLLATPVVLKWLVKVSGGRLKGLFQVAPFALTIYPTYNLIKRFVKSRDAFAGSSFANNGFEWTSGFVLGLAVGQLITAITSCLFLFYFRRVDPSSAGADFVEAQETAEKGKKDETSESEVFEASCMVKFLQSFFGFLLVFTVYAAGVLYGLTWYSCLEDTTCVNADFAPENDGDNTPIAGGVMAVMLVVPTIIMGVVGMCL